MSSKEKAPAASAAPAAANADTLSKADAAKLLKAKKVRVPATDDDGAYRYDSEKKLMTVERAPTEADIVAINEHAHAYHVITVDGRKHAIEK